MSANNQVVVVETDYGWDVWEDYCVDNPFPISAHKVWDFTTLEEAIAEAEEICQGIVEYGIRILRKEHLERAKQDYLAFCQMYVVNPDWPFSSEKGGGDMLPTMPTDGEPKYTQTELPPPPDEWLVNIRDRIEALFPDLEVGEHDTVEYSWHGGYEKLTVDFGNGGTLEHVGAYHPKMYCEGNPCKYCGATFVE